MWRRGREWGGSGVMEDDKEGTGLLVAMMGYVERKRKCYWLVLIIIHLKNI